MPRIDFVGQNLCLAYIMLNKTYSWHRLCSTKPIPKYLVFEISTTKSHMKL